MTDLRKRLLGFSCLAAAAPLLAPLPALAQAVETIPAATTDEASADDVVVVTGSRIKRSNAASPIPLQVFGASDLDEIGSSDLAEGILQLPGVSNSISPQSSNNLIQTSGLSTISLRRLGDDRTLVLIDGKRAVSNSGNSDRVSLSTLPVGFVKRTEITTGGASAIYGSDAVAGVANFILEDSFEGIQLDVRGSTPEASGGEEYRINLLAGTRFSDDRGYVLLGASWRDENEVVADSSRPLSLVALEFDDPAPSGTSTSSNGWSNEINFPGCGGVDTNQHCLVPSRSSSTIGGWFEGGDAWNVGGQWFNDQGGIYDPGDRPVGADGYSDVDGFNFRPGRTLQAERQILSVALRSSYELTPNIEANITASLAQVDSRTNSQFDGVSNSDSYNGGSFGNISGSNPFIHPAVTETLSGSLSFSRRMPELGVNSRNNDRRTIRIIAGFEGNVSDFDWEVYGTYGHFRQIQDNPNEVNFQNARFALDAGPDGSGGVQCNDPTARAAGCVPLNIFGEGSVTPAMADYIRYNAHAEQTRQQYTAGAAIEGPVFEMPAGEVRAAAGVEWRRESQTTNGDPDGDVFAGLNGIRDIADPDPSVPDSDYDVTSASTFPSVSASYNVIEGFAEVDVPVFEGFNVVGAVRIGHYNTVGSIVSFNAGATYQISDDLRLRGQFSRAQRAPNLTELNSPPRPDSDGLEDPCNNLLETGLGITSIEGDGGENADLAVVTANCLTEPGIQQFFADNPGDPFDGDSSVQGPNAGNPNVGEETANTFTAGFVLTPTWIDGLTLVGDYYRIDIKDAITSVSTQNNVSLCYSAADFPNNKFCDRITRSGANGDVTEVLNPQENLANEVVEGLDFSLLYDFELYGVPGEWDFDFRYTHYITDTTTFVGIGGTLITSSPLGEIENGNDEWRAKMGYRNGGFRATYTVTYDDGGVDDATNDPLPTDDRFFEVNGQAYHRIYAAYDFGSDDQFRIYAGVNNLFNNFGPFIPTGLDFGSSLNIVSDLNDALGREFYAGARVRF